jgi:hypothetical protein
MAKHLLLPSWLLLLIAQHVFAMDRVVCNGHIADKLKNGTLHVNDTIFFFDGTRHMSDPTNIGLTLEGCRAQCGAKSDWYPDVGPRLSTWLIPVIVLIGNMQLATLGKRNSFLTLLHLLGDPIDSTWSILTKLEIWNQCYDEAVQLSSRGGKNSDHVRDRGTILAAIHELEGPGSNPVLTYNEIIEGSTIDGDDPARPALHHLCREIANEISDSNSLQLPRTWLAIGSYVFTVFSAFVEAVGGKSSSQPGGRIGTAMFMSWLLPVVLLSNTVGCFTSRRTCLRIMERFAKATKPARRPSVNDYSISSPSLHRRSGSEGMLSPLMPFASRPSNFSSSRTPPDVSISPPTNENGPMDYFLLESPALGPTTPLGSTATITRHADWLDLQLFSADRSSRIGRHVRSTTSFSKAQPWSGAIYTYQPVKWIFHITRRRGSSPWLLLFLSTLPLWIALIFSFLIIWVTPTTGLTCRHFPLMGIFLAWCLSATLTAVSSHCITGKYHWRFVCIKDFVIATPSLVMIFLSSSGMFNSCWCWSAVYSRGLEKAVVLLDPDPARKHNAETVYPGLVSACLFLQTVVFLVNLKMSSRGRSLLRRVEKVKEADFWKLHRPQTREEESDVVGRPRGSSESRPFLRA